MNESTYSTTQLRPQLHARSLKMAVPGARKEALPQVKVPVTKPGGHRSIPGTHMVEREVQPMPVVLSPPHIYAEWFGSLVWVLGFWCDFCLLIEVQRIEPKVSHVAKQVLCSGLYISRL